MAVRWFLVMVATLLALVAAFFGYAYSGCWEGDHCPWWGVLSALVAYAAILGILVEVLVAGVWLVRRLWRHMRPG